MTEPLFLTLDEVLGIHASRIRRYGGSPGVRDLSLLRSSVAIPQATFGGEFLHASLFEMAAAYLFHLVRNHPFVDGNKRTALMCALAFLGMNGQRLNASEDSLFDLVYGAAAGKIGKAEIAVFLRESCSPRS